MPMPPSYIPGWESDFRAPQLMPRILPGIWDNPRFAGPGSISLPRSGGGTDADLARTAAIAALTGRGSGFAGPQGPGPMDTGPMGRSPLSSQRVALPRFEPAAPGPLAAPPGRTNRGPLPPSIARSDYGAFSPASFAPPDWTPGDLRAGVEDPLMRVLMNAKQGGGLRY